MASPFTTISPLADDQPAIVAATDAQLDFIRTLLDERDWNNSPQTSYVERTAVLNLVMRWVNPDTRRADVPADVRSLLDPGASNGWRVNQVLSHLHTKASDGSALNEARLYVAFTKQGASNLIEWLKGLPVKATADHGYDLNVVGYMADTVPAGRYAIDTSVHAVNGTAFYRVDRPTEGRWAGRVFVKQIVGDDEQRLSQKQGMTIIAKIAEAGAEAASARYGMEIGECGVCGRTLTNDESRARGIGPHCAAKMRW